MTTAEVTKGDVEKFLTICGDARAFYMHYQALFEPGNPHDTMFSTVAPFFFGDINLMLIIHIVLDACKLGDPAHTFGRKDNENLSIDFFLRYSNFSADQAQYDCLKRRASALQNFIAKLKPARDKLISHWDRKTVLSGIRGLGGADTDEWVHFWLDLQAFVAILCERYLGQRLYFCGGANSDAGQLVDTLRRSGLL